MKAPLEGNGPAEGRFLTVKIRIPVEDTVEDDFVCGLWNRGCLL